MKLTHTLAIVALSASLGACIIAPPRPYVYDQGGTAVAAAPAPYYASPGPGYFWLNNVAFGWGWHHRQHGWHRGWR
jgi:hypothetical protein